MLLQCLINSAGIWSTPGAFVTFQAIYRIFDFCDSNIIIDNFVLEITRTGLLNIRCEANA